MLGIVNKFLVYTTEITEQCYSIFFVVDVVFTVRNEYS